MKKYEVTFRKPSGGRRHTMFHAPNVASVRRQFNKTWGKEYKIEKIIRM